MKGLIVSNKQLPSIKEGILKGLEIASGAKSSATFYHKREDQIAAVKAAVGNLYNISKELPLLLANQKGSTGFFIQEVLLNEFKKTQLGGSVNIVSPSDWYDEGLSNKLIIKALYQLDNESGITYVLRLFSQFRKEKINNSRARKLALSFIWGHPNLEFISVKYRNKLVKILNHCYGVRMTSILSVIAEQFVNKGVFNDEKSREIIEDKVFRYAENSERLARIFLFMNGKGKKGMFSVVDYPVISQYYLAKVDVSKAKMVPEEVLVGMLSDKSHPQYVAKWSTKDLRDKTLKEIREKTAVTSVNQQIRQTKKNEELGVRKVVDAEKVTDFLALYKTGYENGFTREIDDAISKLAEKKKLVGFPYQNIGIIVDKSLSMKGDFSESKNTPRAIVDFTATVLSKSVESYKIVQTGTLGSDLSTAFLDAVDGRDLDAVFILSDGYENAYEGMLNEVVKAWKGMTGVEIPIYHVSPITGSEMNAKVRTLGTEIASLAINKPEALSLQMQAKLLEADTKQWLFNQFKQLEK